MSLNFQFNIGKKYVFLKSFILKIRTQDPQTRFNMLTAFELYRNRNT